MEEMKKTAEEFSESGEKNLNERNFDGAIADYTEVVKLEPDNHFAYYKRSKAYWNKALFDLEIADLEMAVKLDPNNETYVKELTVKKRRRSANPNKVKIIATIIGTVIGLVIGIIMAYNFSYDAIFGTFLVWIFLGLGSNLVVNTIEDLSVFLEGEPLSELGHTLLFFLLWTVLKSLAGPIFPIRHIIKEWI